LTLKGMFLITMAVGIISSSGFPPGVVGIAGGLWWAIGGDPPEEEKSELFWGDKERLSDTGPELSIHCY
jgi:hypothetical protein